MVGDLLVWLLFVVVKFLIGFVFFIVLDFFCVLLCDVMVDVESEFFKLDEMFWLVVCFLFDVILVLFWFSWLLWCFFLFFFVIDGVLVKVLEFSFCEFVLFLVIVV